MIEAYLHNKLHVGSSNAHSRSEDLLTSTVFGLLRYLPCADDVVAILARARQCRVEKNTLLVEHDRRNNSRWLNLSKVLAWSVEFWRTLPPYGEPDLILRLYDDNHRVLHVVIIEAKLYSGKSGEVGDDGEDFGESVPDPDQLARYGQASRSLCGPDSAVVDTVIYLTANTTPPRTELLATLRRNPEMRLGWLSWRDVWFVMKDSVGAAGASQPKNDLARLLSHLGFRDFTGFREQGLALRNPHGFWSRRQWFSAAPTGRSPMNSFWRRR